MKKVSQVRTSGRSIRVVMPVALIVAAVAGQAEADAIKLLSSVRMQTTSKNVVLRDIAHLDGDAAVALADVVVATIDDSERPLELTVQHVRDRLRETGVNWSRVDLSGGTVIVRPRRSGATQSPEAMNGVSLRGSKEERQESTQSQSPVETAAKVIDDRTVNGEIARLLTTQLHTSPDRLQLNVSRDQHVVIQRSIDDTRFDIQPLGAPMSDRLEVLVREWDGSRIVGQHFVTLHPLLLTELAAAAGDIDRNTMLTDAQLDSKEEWLPPSQVMTTLGRVDAVGRFLETRIRAGEVIHLRDVRKAELIKRGEPLMVRCLVSGVAISMQAEAMTGGGLGDVIEVRKNGERETFLATIIGPGEAIVELSN